ncbi:GIN domain-containing protein [Persicobacter psychrovividus]
MKKIFSSLMIVALAVVALSACTTNDNPTGEHMSPFHSVEIDATGRDFPVTVIQDGSYSVDISNGDFNELDYAVKDGVLMIKPRQGEEIEGKTTIHLGYDLKRLYVHNQADVLLKGAITTEDQANLDIDTHSIVNFEDQLLVKDELKLNTKNGASLFIADLETHSAQLTMDTGAHTNIQGNASSTVTISARNGALFNETSNDDFIPDSKAPLKAPLYDLNIDTGAKLWVDATEDIKGTANNGAQIYYVNHGYTPTVELHNGAEKFIKDLSL